MRHSFYPYVMTAFAVVLVLSNTAATKLIVAGPFVWTAAIIIFPVSYILGDVITEVYGYAGARRIFWVGVTTNAVMSVVYWLTILLPPLDAKLNVQYVAVLGQVPRLVVASMAGIWCGQFANAYVMSRMKVLTKGNWLWTRTISSTLVGETVDTAVFATLGFAFSIPWSVMLTMIYSAAAFKSLYEAAVTPLTYLVVNWFKRHEGEVFDYDVNYSPFAKEEARRGAVTS